jgi:cysteine desulfurase
VTEKAVYLDSNASTKVHPAVLEAMVRALKDHHGNPSSSHASGRAARAAIERARSQVAELLDCQPGEIVFTSGGTESNNQSLQGACFAARAEARRLVTTTIEHPAIDEVCSWLERFGFRTTRIGVDGKGRVDPHDVESAVDDATVLVSVMHANNEIGTIQPVARIATLVKKKDDRILLHTDAAQSVGKIPVRVDDLGVDLLSIAGHKLHAPKGVGALYIRGGTNVERFLHGAGHEGGRRSGTEATPQIVGLGEACSLARQDLEGRGVRMEELRDLLEHRLRECFPHAVIHGDTEHRLPNTSSIGIPGIDAVKLLARLDGVVEASTSAACHSGRVARSAVLSALQVPEDVARGTLRLTISRFTTPDEIHRAVTAIAAAARS